MSEGTAREITIDGLSCFELCDAEGNVTAHVIKSAPGCELKPGQCLKGRGVGKNGTPQFHLMRMNLAMDDDIFKAVPGVRPWKLFLHPGDWDHLSRSLNESDTH